MRLLWCALLLSLCCACAPAQAEKVVRIQAVNRVVIQKSTHEMRLYQNERLMKRYMVALGKKSGKKEREGDMKTPEGIYYIISRNEQSKFYKSLWISYPNALDEARAAKLGVHPGGAIMIHGLPNDGSIIGKYHRATDWTEGCIAVTNEEMEEVWNLVEDGTVVEILP